MSDKVIDLNEIAEGRFVEELSQKISEAAFEVSRLRGAAKVSFTFAIEPNGNEAISIAYSIKTTTPKEDTVQTTFFLHKGEVGPVLRRFHPKQGDLFKPKPPAEVRVLHGNESGK